MRQFISSCYRYCKKHHLSIIMTILTAAGVYLAYLTYYVSHNQSFSANSTKPKKDNDINETMYRHGNQKLPPSLQNTPEKIISEIENVPSLQQEDIAKTYLGIPIDWEVFFSSGRQEDKYYRLFFNSSLNSPTAVSVTCLVAKKNNEHLRRLQSNTKLRIQGTIEDINSLRIIGIKDAKLSF